MVMWCGERERIGGWPLSAGEAGAGAGGRQGEKWRCGNEEIVDIQSGVGDTDIEWGDGRM